LVEERAAQLRFERELNQRAYLIDAHEAFGRWKRVDLQRQSDARVNFLQNLRVPLGLGQLLVEPRLAPGSARDDQREQTTDTDRQLIPTTHRMK
jgi:hypothetical protein